MFIIKILLALAVIALPCRTLLKDIADYKRQEARTKNLIRFLRWEDKTFHTHKDEELIYDPYGIFKEYYEPEQPPNQSYYGSCGGEYSEPFSDAYYEPYRPDAFYDMDEDQIYIHK